MAEYVLCVSIRSVQLLMLLGSIFYFGYLIAQWPAGLAFQKLPVGKFLGSTTIGKNFKIFKNMWISLMPKSSMGWPAHDHAGMPQLRWHRHQPFPPRPC